MASVVKAGYLVKSPPQEKLMAQWHRRYFILWSSKLMEYYTSHEQRPQDYLKTIDLSKCEDMVAPFPMTNRPHIIKLSVRIGTKLRDYYLDCGGEEEMTPWVKGLARVCGFCPVESEERDDDELYSSIDMPEDLHRPLDYDLALTDYSLTNGEGLKKPKLRPPIPHANLKPSFSEDDMLNMTYEEPMFNMEGTYHILENNGSGNSTLERCNSDPERWYDDVGVDDTVVYDMNKCPPPIWKPERNSINLPPPLPPGRQDTPKKRNLDLEFHLARIPLSSSSKSKPLPPPKPKPDFNTEECGQGGGEGGGGSVMPRGFGGLLKDDPKFKRKLQEKRQEIYSDTAPPPTRSRSVSMGEGEDLVAQEMYESITFSVDDEVEHDRGAPPILLPKTKSMKKGRTRSPSTRLRSPVPPLPARSLSPPNIRSPPVSSIPATSFSPPNPTKRKQVVVPSSKKNIVNTSPPGVDHDTPLSTTSPPPLPSRELINPDRPPFSTHVLPQPPPRQAEVSDDDDPPPPPIPIRQSSDRSTGSSSRNLPLKEEKISSISSNSHQHPHLSPKREPISSAHVRTSSEGKPSLTAPPTNVRNGRSPPPVVLKPSFTPPHSNDDAAYKHNQMEESYDDIVFTPPPGPNSEKRAPGPLPHGNDVPYRHNQMEESYDDIVFTPVPGPQLNSEKRAPGHHLNSEIRAPVGLQLNLNQEISSLSPTEPFHKGHHRVGSGPPLLPPNKPSVVRGVPKPTPKPPTAKKPTAASRKPVVPPPTTAQKKPPPPTRPKPSKADGDPNSHFSPSRTPLSPNIPRQRPKPAIPKKPVLPLCS